MRFPGRILTLLAMLAMIAGTLGRAPMSWMCEGRVCSPMSAQCCCTLEASGQDPACFQAEAKSRGTCVDKCRCQATATSSTLAPLASAKFEAPLPSFVDWVAVVPVAPLAVSSFVLQDVPQARPQPPPQRLIHVAASVSSPRAPPAPLV